MGGTQHCSQELCWIVSNLPIMKGAKDSKAHLPLRMCTFPSAIVCQLSAPAPIPPNAVILVSVILEQLASYVLLSMFPIEVHIGVDLQKGIIFVVYIRQYLALVWWGMFNSFKCLLCVIFFCLCPPVLSFSIHSSLGQCIESCLKPLTKT